jgi:hypothetical protein
MSDGIRTGLVVIRVWQEPESSMPLRVEVRGTVDVRIGMGHPRWFASPDEVCTAVRAWLEAIEEPGTRP